MFLTSLRNRAQDFAGVDLCCWTRSKAAVEAVWMSVWWGPRICGFSLNAELAKTWPTGALLKKAFLKFWTGALFSSVGWLGRLPVFVKTYASAAGEVRNLTRSAASSWWDDCFGTERNEP